MTCTNCENPNPDTARFCISCGAPLPATDRIGANVAPPVRDVPVRDTTPLAARSGVTGGLAGATIDGKYRLDAKISSSGLGTIYRATRLLIGDTVSIKVLALGPTVDPLSIERVRREAQASGRLRHQNIVGTFDYGISKDGYVYLVQELVEGQTLRSLLAERKRLDVEIAYDITWQVCAALDEAHLHNVVHRNLKPDNIVLVEDEGNLNVKVQDFGVVRMLDVTSVSGMVTPPGALVGTPQYMAPEQCLGEELDGRADLYSLGIIVYEMLCGVTPFDSPTATVVLMQQVEAAPRPLRSIVPAISPAVEAVVLHALDKKRERRPRTAGAFAEEFSVALVNPTALRSFPTVEFDAGPAELRTNPNAFEMLPDDPDNAVTSAGDIDPADVETQILSPASRAPSGTLVGGTAVPALTTDLTTNPPEPTALTTPAAPAPLPVAPAAPAPPHQARRPGLRSFVTILVPLAAVGAVIAATIGGYVAKGYIDSSSARASIVAEVGKGNLVTPEGSSAYDLYKGSAGGVLKPSDKAAVAAAVAPEVEKAGNAIIDKLKQEGTESDEDWNHAIKLFGWLNELRPSPAVEARLYYSRARLAFLRRDYQGAVDDYQRALERDSGWALALNSIGRAYGRMGDLDNAMEYYRRAAEAEPGWNIAWLNYGSLCMTRSDYQNAEAAFRRAAEIDPSKPSPHNLLAQALERQGRFCDARDEYKAALGCLQAGPSPGISAAALQASVDRVAAKGKCP